MARVWAESKHSGTDLLMMLAIADFADDDGNAYPSVGTLAKKCRTTPRHVNRILAALRAHPTVDRRVGTSAGRFHHTAWAQEFQQADFGCRLEVEQLLVIAGHQHMTTGYQLRYFRRSPCSPMHSRNRRRK